MEFCLTPPTLLDIIIDLALATARTMKPGMRKRVDTYPFLPATLSETKKCWLDQATDKLNVLLTEAEYDYAITLDHGLDIGQQREYVIMYCHGRPDMPKINELADQIVAVLKDRAAGMNPGEIREIQEWPFNGYMGAALRRYALDEAMDKMNHAFASKGVCFKAETIIRIGPPLWLGLKLSALPANT